MSSGTPARSDLPVDPGVAADPVAAVLAAHRAGRLVGLRTSGSTGAPRRVVRSTASWVDSFPVVAELTGFTAGSRVWLPGSLAGTMNLFAATLARHLGAAVVRGPEDATHAHLTPTALIRALDDGAPLAGLRVTVAGDRLTVALRDRAVACGAVVSHYYGASELSFVAWGSCAADLRPFPGVDVQVRAGEIWVRSPFLCEGYAGPPGALRRAADGFATVGDLGQLLEGVLTVSGRGTETVTTGGATVLVADVEQPLRAVATGDVVVVGTPHRRLGGLLVGVLTDARDLPAVRAAARGSLAPSHVPRVWFQVTDLPTGESGKVDRPALAQVVTRPGVVPLTAFDRPVSP